GYLFLYIAGVARANAPVNINALPDDPERAAAWTVLQERIEAKRKLGLVPATRVSAPLAAMKTPVRALPLALDAEISRRPAPSTNTVTPPTSVPLARQEVSAVTPVPAIKAGDATTFSSPL